MKKLVCLVGLPRSGKTTHATYLRKVHGAAVVNPDSFRLALHGRRYCQEAESFVWAAVWLAVRALFLAGHDLIVLDATNVSRKRRAACKAADGLWVVEYHVLPATADECLAVASREGDEEIVPVIERMAGSFEPVSPEEGPVLEVSRA
jgi:predicted kinase